MNTATADQTAFAASAFAIPQLTFASAPALEVRELGGGKAITQKELLDELLNLPADWRLETSAELYALVDRSHQNQHGAYTRDESLKDDWYWTSDLTPWYRGGRVVVSFHLGYVYGTSDDDRAFARAVRVSGQ